MKYCDYDVESIMGQIHVYTFLFFYSFIPSLLILVCNIAMIVSLTAALVKVCIYFQHFSTKHFQLKPHCIKLEQTSRDADMETHWYLIMLYISIFYNFRGELWSALGGPKINSMTRSLIVVSTCYLILTMPYNFIEILWDERLTQG